MRLLFLTFFTFFMSLKNVNAQIKENLVVHYYYKQKIALNDSILDKSYEVNLSTKDTSQKQSSNIPLRGFLQNGIGIESIFVMIANTDSSKTFFPEATEQGSQSGIALIVNTPDTIYYSNGVWKKLKIGLVANMQTVSIPVKETTEKKEILGFECIKFTSTDANTDKQIIFWASKDLPKTLIPYSGLEKFKYGILEIENRRNNSYTVATKIEKQ